MRGVVMHSAGDVRVEEREDPRIVEPTDAVIRLTATCICGSDLWPYRGVEDADHTLMGHEYVGVIEEIGEDVKTVKPGDFVVGSFVISDNTCEICLAGFQSKCVHAEFVHAGIGTQAEKARIPHADGTLVATPGQPDEDLIPSLLAASDVLGTGWFAADAAQAGPGKTVAVVGDGAVGLMAILAARELGAERIIAMSRHPERQKLARYSSANSPCVAPSSERTGPTRTFTSTAPAPRCTATPSWARSRSPTTCSRCPASQACPSPPTPPRQDPRPPKSSRCSPPGQQLRINTPDLRRGPRHLDVKCT